MLVHQHLIVSAKAGNPPRDPEYMSDWVKNLVTNIGMKILSGPHVEYLDVVGNRGLTVVCIIETSHIAIHVWDEPEPAVMMIDVYSCGELHPEKVFEALREFDIVSAEWKFLDRENGLTEIGSGSSAD